ncbi:MAG: AAA family ATPase [Acetomicrobium sp.]|uniref:AAA family ATPase n=1 Tax=Acetomicrobium sp. TaxID=1872099 RepID=UPI0016ABA36A|nr:AAA family ATPase [Synergistota bacterium]NLI43170.1 AAA family ATPase [Synergistaceae bacterium]HOB10457.1 AAA family ATPase [Acetomicrobium sp.]
MLEELHVKNIGGITTASLKLQGNFTAVTGESGAGKSSLVRALELLAGKRAQVSYLRVGEALGEVEGAFLADHIPSLPEELQPQEGVWVVKRVVTSEGRSKSYIQGHVVPLNVLSSAMTHFMHVQSQFSQLDLLDENNQLDLLDSYGGVKLLQKKMALADIFHKAVEMERKIQDLYRKRKRVEERYNGAVELIQLLKELNPSLSSEYEWENELRIVKEAISRREELESILIVLEGGMASSGLEGELENISLQLKSVLDSSNEDIERTSQSVLMALQQLIRQIRELISSKTSLEELKRRHEELESKLGGLRKCKRIARVSTMEELVEYYTAAEREISWLSESLAEIETLKEKLNKLKKDVSQHALDLRSLRTEIAKQLEETVNSHLRDLGMESTRLTVYIEEMKKVRANGAETVSFMIETDNNLPAPISKVASGGELSRILLALQMALPEEVLPKLLVVDEVEAGLGGKAALLTGLKLKELSTKCQIILITHEATIASLADQHFRVTKEGEESYVKELNDEERVQEIARMLSGTSEIREAIAHAMQLLNLRKKDDE